MKKKILLLLILLVIVQTGVVKAANSNGIADIFRWDVVNREKGYVMFLDVPFGEKDNLKYLSIAYAQRYNDEKPTFISFALDKDIVKSSVGAMLGFGRRKKEDGAGNNIEIAEDYSLPLIFNEEHEKTYKIRLKNGEVKSQSGEVNLKNYFLKFDYLFFVYKNKEEIQKSIAIPLYGFKEKYREMQKKN